jgi:hypothetical protein
MKKGIGFAFVILTIFFSGCTGSHLGILFNSTTTIMPPANNDATLATIVQIGNNNPHPIFVFFYGSIGGSRVRFDYDRTKVQVLPAAPLGVWSQYTIISRVPTAPQQVSIYVNYDNVDSHFYDTPISETPPNQTMNVYIGGYNSADHGNATIVVGDATIFAQ